MFFSNAHDMGIEPMAMATVATGDLGEFPQEPSPAKPANTILSSRICAVGAANRATKGCLRDKNITSSVRTFSVRA